MPTRIQTTSPLVLTIVLAVTLLPASALAQTGITGDATGSSANMFDGTKNFKSKSALGQLEELTGTTVDRSSSQSSYRSTVTRVAPQPWQAQPRYDPNQQIAGAFAANIIGSLFAEVFSDNSAQEQAAAQAAAARAAAEAEAFRLQQEAARKARIQMAQHYRADWDSREAEIGDRLDGAFDVTPGTALFGRPANPDADTVAEILSQDVGDASVVDLRGSSLVVQLLRQPVPVVSLRPRAPPAIGTPAPDKPRWANDWDDTDEPAQPSVEDPGLYAKTKKFLKERGAIYHGSSVVVGPIEASVTVDPFSGTMQHTLSVGEGLLSGSVYLTSNNDFGVCYSPGIRGANLAAAGNLCFGTDAIYVAGEFKTPITMTGVSLNILEFGDAEEGAFGGFKADYSDWLGVERKLH